MHTRINIMSSSPLSGAKLQRLGVSLFLWFAFTAGISAQQPGQLPATGPAGSKNVLSLADCVHIGLEHQPSIKAQWATIAAAEKQVIALDRMGGLARVSREMPYRKQQACLGVAISQAGLQVVQWETIYSITRCYFMVTYARQQETVVKNLLEIMGQSLKIADATVQAGTVNGALTQQDADKLRVNIDLLRIRLIEASSGTIRATAALREAMGLGCDEELLPLADALPPIGDAIDCAAVVQMALTRRGELVQVQNLAQVTDLEVCAQNNHGLLPLKLTFAAGADIHSVPVPPGSNNGTYRPAALGVEMPTTLVGRKNDRVGRAQDFSARNGAVVEKTQNLIALEAQDAFHKWQAAADQVKVLRDSAGTSAKLADSITQRFNTNPGKVSSEDYLRARTLDDQTQAQLNEALFHHAIGLAALERITAGGFIPSYRNGVTLP
jgi:outer membrane protein TolC